ncbi:MAG: MFS transporter [Holophaga sp.]|jgi:MFS family permease
MENPSWNSTRATAGRRAIVATAIGNSLEWYDFSVYAFFAVFIGQALFPTGSSQALQAWLAFGIGFIARPLGAVLIGAYGDYAGRKPALILTILLMAVGTGVMASLVGNCLMVVSCLFAGSLSDRIGRRRVLTFATLLMLAGIYPLLLWLSWSHTTGSLILVQTAFCFMVAMFVGVAPATLAGIFPTQVRSSGMSLAYNIAVMIFGGFAGAILTWLTGRPGGGYAPAWYVMAACLVALVAILFLPQEQPAHSLTAPSPRPAGSGS